MPWYYEQILSSCTKGTFFPTRCEPRVCEAYYVTLKYSFNETHTSSRLILKEQRGSPSASSSLSVTNWTTEMYPSESIFHPLHNLPTKHFFRSRPLCSADRNWKDWNEYCLRTYCASFQYTDQEFQTSSPNSKEKWARIKGAFLWEKS